MTLSKARALKGTLLAVILVGLMSGCVMIPGGIAPSTTPIEGREYTNLGRVTARDSRIYLLGLIPVSGANTTQDAVETAIRSKRADALINVTIESYSQWWILFSKFTTRVDGYAIRFR